MAFCMFCGRKLEEGEICNCQSNVAEQSQIQNEEHSSGEQQQFDGNQQMNMQYNGQQMNQPNNGPQMNQPYNGQQINQQQYQERFNQAKEVSGAYLQKLSGALIGILKKPSEEGKRFVASEDRKLSCGFLVMQAILSSIFFLIVFRKINSVVKTAGSYLGDIDGKYLINMPKAFVLTVIGSILLSLAIAALLYLGVKIMKGTATFWNMLCAVAVRSVGTSLFVLAGILVAFLNLTWGIVIFILSALVGLIFMIVAFQGGEMADQNKQVYIICGVAILSIVIFVILCRIGIPMYIPSGLKDGYEQLLNRLSDLDSLSGWY